MVARDMEGDTLVVNVTNQIEDTWFDRAATSTASS